MDPAIPPASDAKAALRELISQKDAMEAQIEALHEASAQGQPLVDAQGFPRADLDVHAIRTARSQLAMLQTDHKNLMSRIERAMLAVHADAKAAKARERPEAAQSAPVTRPTQPATRKEVPADESKIDEAKGGERPAVAAPISATPASSPSLAATAANLEPFYVVQSVSADSPAEVGGLRPGDLVLAFGSVRKENKSASTMSNVVTSSIGRAITVIVRRPAQDGQGEAQIKEIRIIPQQWSGRGLLGCHLVDV